MHPGRHVASLSPRLAWWALAAWFSSTCPWADAFADCLQDYRARWDVFYPLTGESSQSALVKPVYHQRLAACMQAHGRYWEARLAVELLQGNLLGDLRQQLECHDATDEVCLALCAPMSCGIDYVEEKLLPVVAMKLFGLETFSAPSLSLGKVTLREADLLPLIHIPARDAARPLADCMGDYHAQVREFARRSGAAATETLEPKAAVEPRAQQALAEHQLARCWSMGGRYWAVQFAAAEYVGTVLNYTEAASDALGDGVPQELSGGLCAPASCSVESVKVAVLPMFLWVTVTGHAPLRPPAPAEHQATVSELSHWSLVSLDFVVAGVDSCGTNSLAWNLAQHPDIGFTTSGWDEDNFFFKDSLLLPSAAAVDAFGAKWSGSEGRPRMLGLRHPGLFKNARVRQALSRIRDLRVIVVLCDPTNRLDKAHYLHPLADHRRDARWPRLGAVLDDGELPELVQRWALHEPLRDLLRWFGRRLRIVHQEVLRIAPRKTYDELVGFLGLGPFPASLRFERRNALAGHRTDICWNRSVRAAVQAYLV
eukprot:TRINITY_DN17869_c0_g1_i2.p1 TRINITY_DN17869_c0_g1~~TRINITY_DN17869_c0_g1_i2.p1  ORF type:complete len:540 (+),score=72.43 TRINITY_DN17869_c0_g1_i2:76-1695(+)